ncbi:MAG: HAD-IC family P-type ATPase [Candidatus Nomurabacteria bacterium]|jgi:cation-transporting ATPase E|nr:HAD-IC family P-type ATPase [Candidatus Nomurabacteria bacterium]
MRKKMIDDRTGLSSKEVEARTNAGEVNVFRDTASKSVGEIVRSNTLTFFNGLNVCIFILILITGQFKNGLFFGAILLNTLWGIYQELRARKIISKMSLLTRSKVYVIRDSKEQEIDRNEIVLDDICILKKGSQIPADGVIVGDETIEVDESMLTGESDFVVKKKGDKVFGGSLVMLGQTKAQVTAVAGDIYINQLSLEVKTVKVKKSKLQRQIYGIIKVATLLLVVVGPFFFIRELTVMRHNYMIEWQDALLRSLTAAIGMVPEGLVLLTSVALTVGVMTLARRRVLTQELSAIETLARVDVLCLDKTGTLTEGSLKLSGTEYYSKDQAYTKQALAALAAADEEQNATASAISETFTKVPDWKATKKIPFSSRTKWQAVEFSGQGVLILGAPDVVLPNNAKDARKFCAKAADDGLRTLALLKSSSLPKGDDLPKEREVLAVLLLADQVRSNAKETLNYFREQGVDIRVISGDHPATVANICKTVGLNGKCIDAKELPTDPDELCEAVKDITVFGRVTPDQKKQIVIALQANGHTVAMTGDGVNDILALKQSDCGVAMAAGSEATQSVAQFVLLDSNFDALPKVVGEGRRVINNINRVASLFLIKTTWSFCLALLFAAAAVPYPFTPIQLSLLDFLAIGVPSFLLALEPNYELVRGNFIKKTLFNAVPAGLAIFLAIALVHDGTQAIEGLPFNEVFPYGATSSLFVALSAYILTLFFVSRPLTKWRKAVVALVVVAGAVMTSIPLVYGFYGYVALPEHAYSWTIQYCLCAIVATIVIRFIFLGIRRLWRKLKPKRFIRK